jgi:hypothetical protein
MSSAPIVNTAEIEKILETIREQIKSSGNFDDAKFKRDIEASRPIVNLKACPRGLVTLNPKDFGGWTPPSSITGQQKYFFNGMLCVTPRVLETVKNMYKNPEAVNRVMLRTVIELVAKLNEDVHTAEQNVKTACDEIKGLGEIGDTIGVEHAKALCTSVRDDKNARRCEWDDKEGRDFEGKKLPGACKPISPAEKTRLEKLKSVLDAAKKKLGVTYTKEGEAKGWGAWALENKGKLAAAAGLGTAAAAYGLGMWDPVALASAAASGLRDYVNPPALTRAAQAAFNAAHTSGLSANTSKYIPPYLFWGGGVSEENLKALEEAIKKLKADTSAQIVSAPAKPTTSLVSAKCPKGLVPAPRGAVIDATDMTGIRTRDGNECVLQHVLVTLSKKAYATAQPKTLEQLLRELVDVSVVLLAHRKALANLSYNSQKTDAFKAALKAKVEAAPADADLASVERRVEKETVYSPADYGCAVVNTLKTSDKIKNKKPFCDSLKTKDGVRKCRMDDNDECVDLDAKIIKHDQEIARAIRYTKKFQEEF